MGRRANLDFHPAPNRRVHSSIYRVRQSARLRVPPFSILTVALPPAIPAPIASVYLTYLHLFIDRLVITAAHYVYLLIRYLLSVSR